MGYFLKEEDLFYDPEFFKVIKGRQTFVVTEENIDRVRRIPVDVLLPKKWTSSAEYILRIDFIILGHAIPKGYVSDGASVPRPFWPLYPPVDRYLLAAFLHDWRLDKNHGWKESNKSFKDTQTLIGIKGDRKFITTTAVKLNGWFRSTFLGETK